jgi:hypothetical protein
VACGKDEGLESQISGSGLIPLIPHFHVSGRLVVETPAGRVDLLGCIRIG